jgi:hypothetical protein
MMTPPAWFVRAIQDLDSLLSVRWGEVIHRWVVERKALVPSSEQTFLARRFRRVVQLAKEARLAKDKKREEEMDVLGSQLAEELNSALRGYRVILFAPELTRRIYNSLVLSDITRYGGYSRFADELERIEEFRDKDAARQMANQMEAVHKEAYDRLNFAWRNRQSELAEGKHDHLWD